MRLLLTLLAVAALTISVGCAPPADDPAPVTPAVPAAAPADADADADADAPADTDTSAVTPSVNQQLVSLTLPNMV